MRLKTLMRSLKMKRIGALDAIEIPGQPGGHLMVICHGYGADASDLVPLANVWSVPQGTTWLFPNGPIEVPLGPHMTGRAWFDIDVEALEQARKMGTHRDLSNATPSGMKQAREKLIAMVEATKIPWSKVILGGFSQGAMLATMTSFYAPENPKGLIILSGALLDQNTWKEKAKARAGLPYYQSHGTFDDLLALDGAQKLEKVLRDAGLKGALQTFEGAHEIPQDVIAGVNQFLKKLF